MIYTVTLNPSLDYNVRVGSLKTGLVNRTEEGGVRSDASRGQGHQCVTGVT